MTDEDTMFSLRCLIPSPCHCHFHEVRKGIEICTIIAGAQVSGHIQMEQAMTCR